MGLNPPLAFVSENTAEESHADSLRKPTPNPNPQPPKTLSLNLNLNLHSIYPRAVLLHHSFPLGKVSPECCPGTEVEQEHLANVQALYRPLQQEPVYGEGLEHSLRGYAGAKVAPNPRAEVELSRRNARERGHCD